MKLCIVLILKRGDQLSKSAEAGNDSDLMEVIIPQW